MKLKISRREAKESGYWLKLFLLYEDGAMEKERMALISESEQIRNILSFIIRKEQGQSASNRGQETRSKGQ
jgi:hypothetical protein